MNWKPFEPVIYDRDLARHAAILRAADGDAAYRNNKYQVVVKHYANGATRLSIKRNDRAAIHDWRDLQRIKNELTSPEREALELYPAESRKVDGANQYFLFVLPEGERAPFGFQERMISSSTGFKVRQRPFQDEAERIEAAATDRNIDERVTSYLDEFGVVPTRAERGERP